MDRLRKPEVLLALGVIMLGIVALYETAEIPVSPMYAQVGPTLVAYIASGLLIALGLALLAQAWRGIWTSPPEETEAGFDLRAVGWLLLGLVLNIGLIGPLGFIPASVLLFACTARAFGSRRPGRDALIGLGFAAVAYFGFAQLLGINIGEGDLVVSLLEGLI
ncbi:MAG: tripartite tricarboxylate transporter TctB family protein [Ferrovibrio sp.]|uniref:tripartite tricarboxylate transporter TctB family protein n=1 Tax=Ferrovibrio sp. TaxID=1917215 RepID=UPI0026228FC0|nr:tripartite tricarboxylate transporter TctB family protein [Ferrovibrio sp.]MCW0233677.1 tripartite tricarboxylate transporter TctB family protein [Ferrovibrio sp.]